MPKLQAVEDEAGIAMWLQDGLTAEGARRSSPAGVDCR
jgi:hypothetical protein